MNPRAIMIQGTGSDVGKSVIAAAICRLLRNRGLRVAPFKAQNMSNNSYATREGGEIGRAQAAQAEACGVEPSVLMNPVLLKPVSERGAQLVVLGKPVRNMGAEEYRRYAPKLLPVVRRSFEKLRETHDVVVIEGAGSPAEINIKNDIVNMAVAKMARAPVILVGDIDKGGVFAQLTGTFNLLKPSERRHVRAFLINKFRGDKKILEPGVRWLERATRRRVLGVIPYIAGLGVAEEDSLSLGKTPARDGGRDTLKIDVIRLPRISNFTDFDGLKNEKGVAVNFRERADRHYLPDLLVLPGSKSTIADLRFLWTSGLASYVQRCARAGVPVLGICGGYQMLGETVRDPYRAESQEGKISGLGLLPVNTVFGKTKTIRQVKAVHVESGLEISGYEIHMGRTSHRNGFAPFFRVRERDGVSKEADDGIVAGTGAAGAVYGTYIHGLFDGPAFRKYFLNTIRRASGLKESLPCKGRNGSAADIYDSLAETVGGHIDRRLFDNLVRLR